MNKIAVHYASGLYDAAEEIGCTKNVADELPAMASLVELSGELLAGPMLSDAERTSLLRSILTGQVSPLTLEFVLLMASRHVLNALPDAAAEFEKLSGRARVVVRLRVPYPLGDGVLAELRGRLVAEKIIPEKDAARAEFAITIDESLLGGFVAEYGGLQLDTSFKTVLEKAK
jgi:F-type H+-transporting ATPase subunit delta